ncbi:MAG: hypothetical protein QS98_C0002G0009 [archaeon GW2011_AR3]|nr:MAG: hypothetical protein QS98_C0002G0009 [archaeon GW2011_AR3]MBS3110001.1 DUF2283 domain-containing protein [Candidatus Woesearchaeota archaeon]
MPNFNFSYDKENDDLFLFKPKASSKGSIELGNIILDFNTKKEFVGMQVMDASKFLCDLVKGSASEIRNILNNLTSCKIDTKVRGNLLIIQFLLIANKKEIAPIITMPHIIESSPALAYA